MTQYGAELYDALRAICVEAWSNLTAVHYGQPRLEQLQMPYAVIRLAAFDTEFAGTVVEQAYTFEVVYRGSWESASDFNIEIAKQLRLTEFLAAFSASTELGGIGLLPRVTSVVFVESDDPNDPSYEVSMNVECLIHEAY